MLLFTPEQLMQLLIIKRLGKSSVLDTTSTTESFVEEEDSDQLQINFLLNAVYQFSENYSLFIEAAVPFLKREVNVDGLTRAFSAAIGINFRI